MRIRESKTLLYVVVGITVTIALANFNRRREKPLNILNLNYEGEESNENRKTPADVKVSSKGAVITPPVIIQHRHWYQILLQVKIDTSFVAQ